jgi:hypothetical protein
MWRVVIGLWNISRMKHCTNSGFYHYQHKLLEWCLTAICLLLLMMIGGVECNPGPVLRSQKATSETNSLGKRNSCSFHNILYILNKKHCQSYGTDSGIPTYNDMVTMLIIFESTLIRTSTVEILHRQARDWVRCLRNTLIWQLEFLCLHLPFDFMLALNRNRYHLQSPL